MPRGMHHQFLKLRYLSAALDSAKDAMIQAIVEANRYRRADDLKTLRWLLFDIEDLRMAVRDMALEPGASVSGEGPLE